MKTELRDMQSAGHGRYDVFINLLGHSTGPRLHSIQVAPDSDLAACLAALNDSIVNYTVQNQPAGYVPLAEEDWARVVEAIEAIYTDEVKATYAAWKAEQALLSLPGGE